MVSQRTPPFIVFASIKRYHCELSDNSSCLLFRSTTGLWNHAALPFAQCEGRGRWLVRWRFAVSFPAPRGRPIPAQQRLYRAVVRFVCSGTLQFCVPHMQMFGDDVEKREGNEQWVGGRLRGYSHPIVVGTGSTLDLSKERNCLWIGQIGPGCPSLGGCDVYDHNVA